MANYDYECTLDGIYTFHFSTGHETTSTPCPVCKDPMKRKFYKHVKKTGKMVITNENQLELN